jgi:nitrite reductase/ring-hydroxylating ferredoxin subunit
MGEVMRRYWLPALLSSELPSPDCAPVRLRLLGEDLVAFRDTSGRVGILEELCPHRLASLWLGRNEENGLRCVYHGWKFDVDGACIEQMNEPEGFGSKVRAGSYPVFEQGGVIWTYMGRPENRPAEPNYEYTRVDDAHRTVSKVWQECNWLQALEGGIDSSHAPILHRAFAGSSAGGIAASSAFVRGRAPTLEVDFTDYGYRYTGIRPLDEDQQYVRGYHFIMPFTQIRPGQNVGRDTPERPIASGHHWVPIDDNNCMVWNWHYSYGDHVLDEEERLMNNSGNGPLFVDASNDFRAVGNRRNSWLIDRDVQRTQTFTGIPGINAQDRAVQESMGSIVDRSKEHLGPADRAIISARRLLSDAVRAVQKGEALVGTGTSYYNIRSAEKIFDAGIPWREVLLPEMYPDGEKQVAEAVLPTR